MAHLYTPNDHRYTVHTRGSWVRIDSFDIDTITVF